MMVIITIHRRLLTVVVLILILLNNFVITQRIVSGSGSASEQQQQQQVLLEAATVAVTTDTIIAKNGATQAVQQQNGETEKQLTNKNSTTSSAATENALINKTTTTAVSSSTSSTYSSSSSSSSSSSTSPLSLPSAQNSDLYKTGESSYERNSDEILSETDDDELEQSSITPTTFRPARPSVALHNSAQERERKLMNVLAARRNALHRGVFRTRVGTTGRTATSIETTSKSPTDPRSICIRNCTKNFTRRTTAACMRQCANFSRTASTAANSNSTNAATVIVRPSSKTGLGSQGRERDTNEILFTDESSHGLFVVAKEQNDTLNHIPETNKVNVGTKYRARGKPAIAVTLATTSIEDDDIQPYLYFGQKLPPIRPALLAITSISDEHPKLLEVSVASTPATTTTTSTTKRTTTTKISTSTLSAVERSRSRYKYNMPGNIRRFIATNRSPAVTSDTANELRTTTTTTTAKPKPTAAKLAAVIDINTADKSHVEVRETVTPKFDTSAATTEYSVTPTPLIITVLGDEDEVTHMPIPVDYAVDAVPNKTRVKAEIPTTSTTTSTAATTSTTSTTTTTTTAATTTTTKATTTTTPSTTSTTTTTTTTTPAPTTTSSTTTTTTTTTTTAADTTTAKRKTIIEEDTERLRAMGPSLTQPINTDEKTNLIIFVNRTSGVYVPSTASTIRPAAMPNSPTTDSSSTILRTTVLTSVRSTVNPRTTTSTTTTFAPATFVGIVETATAEASIPQQSTAVGNDISSTVVTDDQEVSMEMHRMNIATMVIAGIGIFPLIAVIVYLVRTYVIRRHAKDDEVFDVCITDQQPISPVKKIDGKHHSDEVEDEVDNHMHNVQNKMQMRDANHNHRFDEQCSISSEQEFDRSNIRLKSLLGEGNFGQVWKAEADDLSGHFGATRIVAVKTIRACSAQVSLKDEAYIMRKLGSHPNVVTLLGACVESEPHMLIMEYAMRGRLLSLLRAARNATNILPASVPGGRSLTPLSPRTLAGFALDIACGMEYIAGKRIVHRDLAARNVLLDHNGVCKICDFGMSIDLDAERKKKEQEKNCANDIMRSNANKFKFDFGGRFIMQQWNNNFGAQHCQQHKDTNEKKAHAHGHGHGHDTISRRPALPIRWMAPEALQFHVFTNETDVWAFGIVLWEIATLGSTPYSQLTGREVIRRVPHGLRPDLPKEGRHEFYNLMSRCWHKDAQMRPTFTQARLEISRSMHKWVDDDSAASDYMDVSGFSEDLEHGMVYFNHRISEFECEI